MSKKYVFAVLLSRVVTKWLFRLYNYRVLQRLQMRPRGQVLARLRSHKVENKCQKSNINFKPKQKITAAK